MNAGGGDTAGRHVERSAARANGVCNRVQFVKHKTLSFAKWAVASVMGGVSSKSETIEGEHLGD
ncbi:hypothetical protein BSY16_5454 (plasmid) [Sinorhizobium sp. RAC02]|nr:hypothetical protein BSY16_5454 [Sinorhizobium sp. RAC02]